MKNLQQKIEYLMEGRKYDEAAETFLSETGAEIEIQFHEHGRHFDTDKEDRDIYTVLIKRGSRKYEFKFGNSVADSGFYYTMGKNKRQIDRKYLTEKWRQKLMSFITMNSGGSFRNNWKSDIIHYPKKPSKYTVIACLQKDVPGTHHDFCSDFGYDKDSISALKVYKALLNEYINLSRLFSDSELRAMSEIV